MKVVIQRVSEASVFINEKLISQIKRGFLIFVGFAKEDSETQVLKTAEKILKLRIFPDEKKDLNLSIKDIQGEILIVSQFTLLAQTKGANRPSFIKAAPREKAKALYSLFVEKIKSSGLKVASGVFGETMKVKLVNEGPVTIILEE
jgi:D-tyrosyl-tRNA(Tyr) deacylase